MKQIDIEISDPFMSLNEWKILIDNLIKKHGPDAILLTDAGPNNVSLKIEPKGAQNG